MNPHAPRFARAVVLALLTAVSLLSLVGCGGSGQEVVEVSGRVTRNGSPMQVEGRDVGLGMVQLEFYPVLADGTVNDSPESTVADESGAFTLRGRDGGGIPPGKYKIVVYQWEPYPQVDRLEGRYDKEHTSLEREITGGEVVLDLTD